MSLVKDLTSEREPEVATHTIVPTGRRTGVASPTSHLRKGMWVTWVGPRGEALSGDDEKRVGIVTALDPKSDWAKADVIDVHGLTLLAGVTMFASKMTQATAEEIPRSRRKNPDLLRAKGYIR